MKRFFLMSLLILAAGWMAVAQNPRNVLLYNLTDTDCGPCSCMDSIIRGSVDPSYPQTVVVALHSPMMNSHFKDYQGNEVFFYFRSEYEPSGFLDGLGHDIHYQQLTAAVGQRYADSPQAPVKINVDSKTWDPVSRNVTLTLSFTNLEQEIQVPCWFNIFVTENNLIAAHRVWTGCATPSVPTPPLNFNFINDHVIRKLEYFHTGDSLIGPVWPNQHSFSRTFTVHIDTGWVESNCNLVFAVYEKNDSLYKAAVKQAISENVTGGVGIGEKRSGSTGIDLVYPNPASDWINIHLFLEQPGVCRLSLHDLAGKTVTTLFDQRLEAGRFNAEYQAGDIPPGVYLLKLNTPAGQSVRQVIIR